MLQIYNKYCSTANVIKCTEYTGDTIRGYKWSWEELDGTDGQNKVIDLRFHCQLCDTLMACIDKGDFSTTIITCPRCDFLVLEDIDIGKVEMIIFDNIRRAKETEVTKA